MQLEKKKEIVDNEKKANPPKILGNKKKSSSISNEQNKDNGHSNSDSDEDDDNFNEYLDWRAKKSQLKNK